MLSRVSIVISSLAVAGLAAGFAAAQPAPPAVAAARAADPASAEPLAPPPPPPRGPHGPRAEAPPPPPRGPSIRVERDAGGAMRLDVHCGEADSAKTCADTTLAIFDKVNAPGSAR